MFWQQVDTGVISFRMTFQYLYFGVCGSLGIFRTGRRWSGWMNGTLFPLAETIHSPDETWLFNHSHLSTRTLQLPHVVTFTERACSTLIRAKGWRLRQHSSDRRIAFISAIKTVCATAGTAVNYWENAQASVSSRQLLNPRQSTHGIKVCYLT